PGRLAHHPTPDLLVRDAHGGLQRPQPLPLGDATAVEKSLDGPRDRRRSGLVACGVLFHVVDFFSGAGHLLHWESVRPTIESHEARKTGGGVLHREVTSMLTKNVKSEELSTASRGRKKGHRPFQVGAPLAY